MPILEPEEEAKVKRTWALVSPDLRKFGMNFFVLFFRVYPNYQRKFKGFADIPAKELPKHRRMQAHAFTVMTAIAGLIYNLDDTELVTKLLIKAGKNHANRHLEFKDFKNLQEAFTDFFSDQIGPDHWRDGVPEAWEKLLNAIMDTINIGLQKGIKLLNFGSQMI